ncbi:hypothetical protein D9M72_481870 [compost metagenome]
MAQFALAVGVPDRHDDRVTGRAGAGTADQRPCVVGGAARDHVAGDAAHGVQDAGDGQLAGVGRGDVDLEVERRRRQALVAGRVARDERDGMKAFRQVGRRREAPLAVGAHGGPADVDAVVLDEDGVAGRALAVEVGLAVIADGTCHEGAQDVACVIEDVAHCGRLHGEGRYAGTCCRIGVLVVGNDVRLLGSHGCDFCSLDWKWNRVGAWGCTLFDQAVGGIGHSRKRG